MTRKLLGTTNPGGCNRQPNTSTDQLPRADDQADAVLTATPQYNPSLPGQLKNALDWASRPNANSVLQRKPVAVIGASPGPTGAARAQAEARVVLGAAGAQMIDASFCSPAGTSSSTARASSNRPHCRSLSRLLDQLALAAVHTDRVAAAA